MCSLLFVPADSTKKLDKARYATGFPERWRSTRRKCLRSTRCSRQARKRSPAQAVVDAFANGPGVVSIDGVMYDRPHLVRAQQLLKRAVAAAKC